MKLPKLSIIVPVYNVEKYLERCLKSLVNQTIKDLEVIIINDGKITAVVASRAPKIPDVVNPAKVATFTPTGPGVIDATASISVNCLDVYQWNLSAISYKNGKVA